MVTAQDRDVSRMQSKIAAEAQAQREVAGGALEAKFGTGLTGGDWWGWLKSTLDWVDRTDAHEILRPSSATPATLPDKASIALAGDWGTGLYGAPHIADEISKRGPFDLLLHLGDVYYSGTKEEVQERLIDLWPVAAGRMTRTLNSNHEMYSGGYGYFDLALKAFKQEASYFAFQNKKWLLIGLDTAYVDHDMDYQQISWLNSAVSQAGTRKIVLFSHQQLFSRLDEQGPKLKKALSHLLNGELIKVWYWGHEHQCVLYDRHPDYNLVARCLGNGGVPEPRKSIVTDAPAFRLHGNLAWKQLDGTQDSPPCLVLDGPNRFIPGEEDKFVPHGFMTLDLDGDKLTERVFSADGVELFVTEIQ
jgi:predicted phosphodiesterase